MGIVIGFFIIIGYVFLVLLLRSLTTLFHELGHAIPALIFTNEDVKIMIGSYGDRDNGRQIKIGRLSIFLKFNLFSWNKGLCEHAGIPQMWKYLIVIIGGPLASIVICLPLVILMTTVEFSELWRAVIMIFIFATLIDFIININPFGANVRLDNRHKILTDGQKISAVISRLQLPPIYFELEDQFMLKNYKVVKHKAQELINTGNASKSIYNLMISVCKAENLNQQALKYYYKLNEVHKLNYDDFYDVGKLYAQQNQPIKAIEYYNHCVFNRHKDPSVLYDRALAYKELGDYKKSKMDLDASLHYDNKNVEAYAERAFVNLKLKETQNAYNDLVLAKKLDPSSPKLDYYLGLYYEEIGDFDEALTHLEKAKRGGVDYHGIDYRINIVFGKRNKK